ncbi:MAG: UDP-N-acetylmuramate--L-alanine ligase [Betaproteobacteria bacterium]|nr:UDP-N-acetylmuramate--L-alanine ligase [Betaproteobacteria bacterium]
MRRKIRRIHFVGIGGAGMCGLAEVAHGLGYEVSGSDAQRRSSLTRLRRAGVRVFVGHDAAHAADADCVVYSGAVPADNPERAAAVARGVPVIPRAQMLGEMLRFKSGVAVTGTHGKTTVSSMLASILTAAGFDPTCIIGGRLLADGGHARIGGGEFVIAEADESDASFLHLHPEAAVVTNIDDDHLSAFGGDFSRLRGAFLGFLGNLPFYGAAVMCADDAAAAALADEIASPRVVRYGMRADAEVRATDAACDGAGMRFVLRLPGGEYPMRLRAAGAHNVLNAAGACAMARELGAETDAMAAGLENFQGVARRLESHGKIAAARGGVFLMDDYAHHPAEITAAVAAVRGVYPGRRLFLVFQPHRYTRTRDVFSALVAALRLGDALVLLPVYSAGETPLPGADSDALAAALKKLGTAAVRAETLAEAADAVRRTAADGDVVLTMGAGDVGGLPALLKGEA